MAPKSGEVDTVEGGKTEPETTNLTELAIELAETTELATEIESLTLGKNKTVISATEDSASNEELDEEDQGDDEGTDPGTMDASAVSDEEYDEGSGEEEEKGSTESDQVWGFDSFEGSDYETPEDPPSDDDEFEFCRYARHYHESQGFRVDKEMVPKRLAEGLRPLDLDKFFIHPNLNGLQYSEIAANVAIDKYNQTQNKTLTLDKIVRTVILMHAGVKAYITFMAKESPQGDLVEYQAKTERKSWQENIHAIFCRPAPKA